MFEFFDITKAEIKYINKVLNQLDKNLECINKKKNSLSDEEVKEINFSYKYGLEKLAKPLAELLDFEVNYSSFEKNIENEEILKILEEAYSTDKYKIWAENRKTRLRLDEKAPGSKREARSQLEKLVKGAKKQQGILTKLLFSKETKITCNEAVYEFRDWLINDFDDLIDKIEPVRQEYIISRRGGVEPEEVEKFLLDKFEEYQLYSQWVTSRHHYAFLYYPDLKIE